MEASAMPNLKKKFQLKQTLNPSFGETTMTLRNHCLNDIEVKQAILDH